MRRIGTAARKKRSVKARAKVAKASRRAAAAPRRTAAKKPRPAASRAAAKKSRPAKAAGAAAGKARAKKKRVAARKPRVAKKPAVKARVAKKPAVIKARVAKKRVVARKPRAIKKPIVAARVAAPLAAKLAAPTLAAPATTAPRKGPRIIAVPSAARAKDFDLKVVHYKAPQAPLQAGGAVAQASRGGSKTPVNTAPLLLETKPQPAPPTSVRVGRLPPREASNAAASVAPAPSRRSFPHEMWKDAERAAARIGFTLDRTARQLVRGVFESGAAVTTAPRGAGHENIAILLAQLLPHTVLVVGPEAPLLADLGERFSRAGLSHALLDETRGEELLGGTLDRIAQGSAKVVLTTPRWLSNAALLRALSRARLSFVTVLEAQRTSTFSPSFCPAHAQLATHLERLGRPAVFALAPGAGSSVVHDIVQVMAKDAPFVAESTPVRQNVSLSFYAGRGEVQKRAFFDVMRRVARPAIVLCNSPREVDAVHNALGAMGLPAHRYHEELRPGVRAGEQLSFSMGERAVLVATSAFAPGSGGTDNDPEGVPARYGRRTAKNDVRSLVRFDPPASIDQLVDEMSLVSRDGHAGEIVVFYDPSDRSRLQADLERSRPSGEHFLSFGKGIEAAFDAEGSITVEALALAARSTRRAIESVADLLAAMGLIVARDGWLRFANNQPTLTRELRSLAERLATVRALDARRLAELELLGTHPGCGTAELRRFLGENDPPTCGACVSCRGLARDAALVPSGPRHAPARRFTVTAPGEPASASTFRTDARAFGGSPLTAKLADFR